VSDVKKKRKKKEKEGEGGDRVRPHTAAPTCLSRSNRKTKGKKRKGKKEGTVSMTGASAA